MFQRTIELGQEFQRIQYDVSGGLPRQKLVKQYLARAKPDLERARNITLDLFQKRYFEERDRVS